MLDLNQKVTFLKICCCFYPKSVCKSEIKIYYAHAWTLIDLETLYCLTFVVYIYNTKFSAPKIGKQGVEWGGGGGMGGLMFTNPSPNPCRFRLSIRWSLYISTLIDTELLTPQGLYAVFPSASKASLSTKMCFL